MIETIAAPPTSIRHRVANVGLSLALVGSAIVLSPGSLVGLAVVAVTASATEILWPLHRQRRPLRSWATDLTHAVGNRYLVLAGLFVVYGALHPFTEAIVPDALVRFVHGQSWWAQAAGLFVLTDLGSYLGHRAMHRFGPLWRLHRVHHSSEHLDWLATSRVHPLDLTFNLTTATLPALVLGYVAEQPWLIAFQFLYPFLLHSNARVRVPVVGHVLVCPEFHHWHHAAATKAHGANFGALLSVWDRLLGTDHEPGDFPDRYGIGDGALADGDYLSHLRAPVTRR